MKTCECGNTIPRSVVIDGKRRNLCNRTKCLTCIPFEWKKTPEDHLSRKARNSKDHYNRQKEANGGLDPINVFRSIKKDKIVDKLGGKCQLCGYNKLNRNLAFHHLSDKEFGLDARAFKFSWDRLIPELLKCILVCHNCHGEIHGGIINQVTVETMNGKVKELLKDFQTG